RSGDMQDAYEQSSTPTIEFSLQEVLQSALERLPEIQKTVVLLRDYEGYNYTEIAEITDLSESQVKVYIFRARKALKTYIKRLDIVI
ncbi:MAG: RNA polymerase sigma factor, partial [Crocinitomicaceae bacterium]|nr:RNA polymerase sigma factor [Crocinitomicaceae bacterium]